MNTIETENTLGIAFSERLELAFTHGRGSRVWDEAGREYLDFTSGWGVACLGHAHPAVVDALCSQAQRLMQGPNAGFTYSPARSALLATMKSVLPEGLERTYFCNSGAEANDAALKLARRITGRNRVVSTLNGFHGRTFNTLAVSRGPENKARFPPANGHSAFVPFGATSALAALLDGDTAAFIVEPVQGEGGVNVADGRWLAEVAALCRDNGTLFIADEIQTGFCRTGRFFALEHAPAPLRPDIMTMAKGIAGGFPFAAFAVSARVHERLLPDDHGGTYCGNPLGCAVADAVIRYLRDKDVASHVEAQGKTLMRELHAMVERHPGVLAQARGQGLLCALQFRAAELVRPVTRACAEHGLLVVPTRNGVLRLMPNLLVSTPEIATACATLGRVLGDFADQGRPRGGSARCLPAARYVF